jgi:C4-dicarboxylate-specific signal transduction histidine kinase
MLGTALALAAVLAALQALSRQRSERQRAEELLRLGQVARLNTLGELAAGMAHELNQPLTAVLANTQAASRLLAEDPPDIDTARTAMGQAVQQSRRATDVVGRLRKAVERPGAAGETRAVDLAEAVGTALYLLEPEMRRHGVTPPVDLPAAPLLAQAEPVALGQIIHNLLINALQAMDAVPATQRSLQVGLATIDGQAGLMVADTGPGIAADALPRLFEPFFTTRQGGLGLGLSLCETLATSMGGQVRAGNQPAGGAVFTLTLPLAAPAGKGAA